ncbi:unnamed protein product [Microthlaspi erraticum]|uniref:Uncharacterized protein n=1 Tax=Microthlaspi erraticum TaxID=1685480 RepID=A0A6D2K896_9BRAS|nr:unnamed protein product [Microthlaspi erraticum]
MEKKILIVLCIVFLVEMSSLISGVDCRVLRTEGTTTNGCDQTAAVDGGGGFGLFSAANSSSEQHRPLMRSLAFRLASGPSRKGRGH